jgi:hypothetical protein
VVGFNYNSVKDILKYLKIDFIEWGEFYRDIGTLITLKDKELYKKFLELQPKKDKNFNDEANAVYNEIMTRYKKK